MIAEADRQPMFALFGMRRAVEAEPLIVAMEIGDGED
jgi:hypothetical protein